MTPRTPSLRVRMSRHLGRRAAAIAVAGVAVGAAPLTVHADDVADPVTTPQLIIHDGEPIFGPTAEPEPAEATAPAPDEAADDPIVEVLTDSYDWDERSPRVEALQITLGVTADGWYGRQTVTAHRAALEFADLPLDTVPEPVLPAGPSADAWAALRDCESGGDYTITNPSGTYRGAYQFNRSTWDAVAGRHDPDLVGVDPAQADSADQDALALALWHERGSSPWPHCGRHLG